MFIVLYLGCKLIVYSLWCFLGMHLFQSPRLFAVASLSLLDGDTANQTERSSGAAAATKALQLGFFRLAIGMVFGTVAIVAAWIFVSAGSAFDSSVFAYVVFLIPVRALEWWITARMIRETSSSTYGLLWVFGGVVLSCLGDIPIGLTGLGSFGGLC